MKVVIEGLGSIAQKHITALRKLIPEVEIFGLRSSKSGVELEGVTNIYDYGELSSKPDFIIISNSTQFHRRSIKKALFLGVPLMIEKPVLHSIEEADKALEKELEAKNIKTYVACNLRFHAVLLFLNDYLKNSKRRINEVNVYCGSYFPNWRPNRDYKEIYSAKNTEGGGIHLELFHELDYTCWLFGLPNHTKRTLASKSSIDIEAADFAHYLLEYPDFFTTITLNFYRKTIKRSIEILFDDEIWNVDLVNTKITNEKNEIIFSSDFKMLDTYILQMHHMIDIVNEKATSINTYQDSLEILKICLAND